MDIINNFKKKGDLTFKSGVKSFRTWKSIAHDHFKEMFALREGEVVTEIKVDEDGIQATIERK